MENDKPPEGFKFSKLMDPNKDEKELKPKIDNIDIGIMRTDIETMIRQISNNEGDIEVMKTIGDFYYLLLKTYEVELQYIQRSTMETERVYDFFERGGVMK